MKKFAGIITKLEFKAILYIKGFSKNQIIDIINMEDYFCINYKNGLGFVTSTNVDKKDICNCISNHSKTLLTVQN